MNIQDTASKKQTSESPSVTSSESTIQPLSSSNTQNKPPVDCKLVFVKIALFIFIAGFYLIGFVAGYRAFILKKTPAKEANVLLQAPIKMVTWQDIGKVSDPVLELPVKIKSEYKTIEFLLDSGAVISSLPRETAEEMGLELAFLKRIAFVGYGGTESFAYKGTMKVLFKENEEELPVVFTQSYGTRALLGRQGFFDEYIITFNQKEKIIEIRK